MMLDDAAELLAAEVEAICLAQTADHQTTAHAPHAVGLLALPDDCMQQVLSLPSWEILKKKPRKMKTSKSLRNAERFR